MTIFSGGVEARAVYSNVSLDDVEPRELDDLEPTLRSVGYELRPDRMRPSVWEYDAGESSNYHRHEEQEELYVVLEGRFEVTVERDDEREVLDLETDDYLVVPPETWRQLEAKAESRLFVVGAPSAKEDAITKS